jgi:hypothetical protein
MAYWARTVVLLLLAALIAGASASWCRVRDACSGKTETGTTWTLRAAPQLVFSVAEPDRRDGVPRGGLKLLQMAFRSTNGSIGAELQIWRHRGSDRKWTYDLVGPTDVAVEWIVVRLNGGLLSVDFETNNASNTSYPIVYRETVARFDVLSPPARPLSENTSWPQFWETTAAFSRSSPSNSSCRNRTQLHSPSTQIMRLEIHGWESRRLQGALSSATGNVTVHAPRLTSLPGQYDVNPLSCVQVRLSNIMSVRFQ